VTQQVKAAIVISQATVSAPGGYASGSRDDLIQGQTITLTNLDDTDVIAWSWEITPATGRQLSDYGVTGSSGATCTLTPPAAPDGWGDAYVKLTVTGPKLSTGAINQRTTAVILGIRQPSADYAAGVPLPSPLESDRGGLVTAEDGKGWRDRVGEALFALQEHAFGGRQSHADAVLWYPLTEDAATFPSHGTSTDYLAASGTYTTEAPGPLGKCLSLSSGAGLVGADAVGLGADSCTIWAWVLPPEVNSPRFCWGKIKTTDSSTIFALNIEGGIVTATIKASTLVSVSSDGTNPPIAGVPNLLVASYNKLGGKVYLFVNGLYVADTAASGAVTWVTEVAGQTKWIIGGSAYTDNYVGRILETGADSRAYSGAEIAEMYRRGMGWRA